MPIYPDWNRPPSSILSTLSSSILRFVFHLSFLFPFFLSLLLHPSLFLSPLRFKFKVILFTTTRSRYTFDFMKSATVRMKGWERKNILNSTMCVLYYTDLQVYYIFIEKIIGQYFSLISFSCNSTKNIELRKF